MGTEPYVTIAFSGGCGAAVRWNPLLEVLIIDVSSSVEEGGVRW